MTRVSPLAIVLAVVAPAARADPGLRPHLQAIRIPRPPSIDGQVDEAAWRSVPATDAFTQKFPQEGAPPGERTLLRVAYDDDALYVALECEQRAAIRRPLTRRDRAVEADWVAVAIDPRGDGKSGFDFQVNAAGVQSDAIRFDDTDLSADWDENWEARTALTGAGWSAELRIPLRVLRFGSGAVQSWGLQVRRHISDRQETDEWAFIPRSTAAEVSHYGRLDGLAALAPARHLELTPTVWSRYRRRDAAPAGVASGGDLRASAGLDLTWHPSQALTVAAAFFPDFGQVEADQVVLNLTSFETTYPEKRRFFLEGMETFFLSEVSVLYTRRIGATPPAAALAPGETPVDLPEPAAIDAAVKLTGHGGGWEVGALAALTERQVGEVQLEDGARERRTLVPFTSYGVLRVKRAVGNGHLGLTATSVLRAVHGPRHTNDAHVLSLDWRWRSPGGDYVTIAQLAASRLDRGPPRLIRDGTSIRPGTIGTASRLVLSKDGGAHWLGNVWGAVDGRTFEVNDLGYLDRANQLGFGGELTFRTLAPRAHTLETTTRLSGVFLHNHDGLPTERSARLTASAKLDSFWTVTAMAGPFAARYDDREVGDGTALERAGGLAFSLAVDGDPRRPASLRLYGAGELVRGGHALRADATLLLRLAPPLDVEVVPEVSVARGEPRYAATAETGEHLFGTLAARSAAAILRATYTFTPRLTLQAYAQLFLASRHYGPLAAAPAGSRIPLGTLDLATGATPPANPDATEGALNVNAVLRWEYRLGSLVYLVYTRAQTPALIPGPGGVGALDLGALRRGPAADVVLLKLSWWSG